MKKSFRHFSRSNRKKRKDVAGYEYSRYTVNGPVSSLDLLKARGWLIFRLRT